MNTQYRKNLKAVAQACKDYTDNKIKKVYYDIGHNDITTEDHTNELAYQITAPAGAKLLQLMSVGGNAVKYSPSVASDDTLAFEKTLPDNAYEVQCNYIGGYTEKSENLIENVPTGSTTINGATIESLDNGTFECNGTCTGNGGWTIFTPTLVVGQTYTIEDFATANCFVRILFEDNGTTVYNWNTQPISSNYVTHTIGANETNFRVQILAVNTATYNNDIIKPMLVSGSTAPTTFKAGFTGLRSAKTSEIKVTKNLYDESNVSNGNIGGSYEVSSYTATTTSITISNRGNSQYNRVKLELDTVVGKTYTLKATASTRTRIAIVDSSDSVIISNENFESTDTLTFTATTTTTYVCFFAFYTSSITFSNINVYKNEDIITNQIPSAIYNNEYYGLGYDDTHYNKLDLITRNIYADYNFNADLSQETNTQISTGTSTGGLYWLELYDIILANQTYVKATMDFKTTLDGWNSTIPCLSGTNNGNLRYYTTKTTKVEALAELSGVQILYPITTQTIDVSQYITTDFKKFITNNQYTNVELVNQYNYDMPNMFEYYGTIKETLCPSITITRNGVDILTRNLPTQASDGYGVNANAHNLRVFSDYEGNETKERHIIVGKVDLGSLNYQRVNANGVIYFETDLPSAKTPIDNSTNFVGLCDSYPITNSTSLFNGSVVNAIALNISNKLRVSDTSLSDGTAETFKTAMSGVYLYYELATEDISQLDDFDYFFDVEEGDVITFNNPYAQQVYATYSFLIKEAKSNE